jgi:hypothetical protein
MADEFVKGIVLVIADLLAWKSKYSTKNHTVWNFISRAFLHVHEILKAV